MDYSTQSWSEKVPCSDKNGLCTIIIASLERKPKSIQSCLNEVKNTSGLVNTIESPIIHCMRPIKLLVGRLN